MNTTKLKIVLAFPAAFSWQLLLAQTNTFTVSQIDSITKKIDLTCLNAGIEDGVIKNAEATEKIGNFSNWYYTDSSRNHLVKVVYEESVCSYDFTTYYFFEDKLIHIFFKRGKETADKIETTSIGKYYFQNDQLIDKADEIDFAFDKSIYFKQAKNYLKNTIIWGKVVH
jgi:hypothetical protein